MLKIKCKLSKKGVPYLVLVWEVDNYDIYLNMQESTIIQLAKAVGNSPVEVYSLKPSEYIDIYI